MTRMFLMFGVCCLFSIAGCTKDKVQPVTERPWEASPLGVGPLQAGALVSDISAILQDTAVRLNWNPPDCDYMRYTRGPAIPMMIFGDTVVRFDIDSSGIRTTLGIGVGSTEAEVRAQYPGVTVTPHPYDGPVWHYMNVRAANDTAFGIVFETDGFVVRSYRVGWWPAVELAEGCS